jgi:hypothetical protein
MESEFEIKINPDNISGKFIFNVGRSFNFLSLSLNAVAAYQGEFGKIESASTLPIVVSSGNKCNLESVKKEYKLWILQKTFEDITKYIVESLVELVLAIKVFDYGQKGIVARDFFKTVEDDRSKLLKACLPKLLDEYKKYAKKFNILENGGIPLREDIESLNFMRKCLVHKSGICERDYRFKWRKLVLRASNGDEIVPGYVTKEETKVQVHLEERTKDLKKGDMIDFSLDEYQEIAYTCIHFVKNCVEMMKKLEN